MFERLKVAVERLDPGSPFARYSLLRSLAAYAFARAYLGGRGVLDAACGAGHGLAHLRAASEGKWVGLDLSLEALLYAKRSLPFKNIFLCCGDLSRIPFREGSFDAVLSFQVVEHLSPDGPLTTYFEEIRRVLKEGGLFFISTLNKEKTSHGLNPFHVKEYTASEFERMVRRFFPNSEFFGLEASVRYRRFRRAEERFGKAFLRTDRFNIRNRLPRPLWIWAYTFFTYCVNAWVTLRFCRETLTLEDFRFVSSRLPEAFDLLAVCHKESSG